MQDRQDNGVLQSSDDGSARFWGRDRWAQRLLDAAGEAFVSLDADGRVVEWNRAAEQLFGFPRGTAVGRDLAELIVPVRLREAHRAGVRRWSRRSAGTSRERQLVMPAVDAAGGEFPVRIAVVATDVGGHVRLDALLSDARDRSDAQESATRLASVTQASRDAIITIDRAGVITSWNPAAERLYGYAPQEALGRPLSMLLPAGSDKEHRRLLAAAAAHGPRDITGAERIRRDGRSEIVDITISPLRDSSGDVIGFVGVTRPARSQAERELGQFEQRIRDVCAHPNSVRIVLQPIVDLTHACVVGYEALTRFPSATSSPAEWFTAATQLGLSGPLEAATIRAALARRTDLPHDAFLSLNVSPHALLSEDVRDALAAPDDLHGTVIEITEQSAVSDYGALDRALVPLRARGARVAIDDTGAGYASLRHVLAMAPDLVKVDRSLISNLHRDPARAAVVETLAALAGRIDASLIAEGIESPEELRALASLDVPYAQGYLLGRPQAAPVAIDTTIIESVVSRRAGRRR